jgi:hypothetical protein
MRSLSITALMIVAAFVLGLALGGQAPREAAAQQQLPEISWKTDGETLVISNNTKDKGFLVRGSFSARSEAEVPPSFVDGILKVAVRDLGDTTIYDLNPVFHCDGLGCRSCDEMPVLCEMPPRPLPIGETAILSIMSRSRW